MRTILLVDDEAAARYGTGRALEKQYKVIEAGAAAAGGEALAAGAPDLILLDLVMPGEDGISFLRWLRENGHEMPVLVVSALDTAQTAVEALQSGAADYIVKGFDIEELRRRVGNLLRLSELAEENTRLRRELVADGQFGRLLGASEAMRRGFWEGGGGGGTGGKGFVFGGSGAGE